MSYTNIINPKPCNYNCGTRIYWNNEESAYFEVFTKQRHSCPNRTNNSNSTVTQTTTQSKPNYYNKFTKQPRQKMSNSFELLTGPVSDIQKKYEILSDIVTDLGGKTNGSQSHIGPNNYMSLVIYFEVPDGKREEVKQRFDTIFARNQVVLQR